jgi:hypothetical protein
MEKPARYVRFLAGGRPRLAEIADRLALPVEYKLGKPLAAILIFDCSRGAAPLDDGNKITFERYGLGFARLRVLAAVFACLVKKRVVASSDRAASM